MAYTGVTVLIVYQTTNVTPTGSHSLWLSGNNGCMEFETMAAHIPHDAFLVNSLTFSDRPLFNWITLQYRTIHTYIYTYICIYRTWKKVGILATGCRRFGTKNEVKEQKKT